MVPYLHSSTLADDSTRVVGDMHGNELSRFGRHRDCLGDVLVPLSQKDRVLKASFRHILRKMWLNVCV